LCKRIQSRPVTEPAQLNIEKKLGADWIVIEERRVGRRKLALVTMFKEKATSH